MRNRTSEVCPINMKELNVITLEQALEEAIEVRDFKPPTNKRAIERHLREIDYTDCLLCNDCGLDTTPRKNGVPMRRRWELFMLRHELWESLSEGWSLSLRRVLRKEARTRIMQRRF